EKDSKQAIGYREGAAYSGHAASADWLANNEKCDVGKMMMWLKIAANTIPNAQYKLGKIYANEKDIDNAVSCFEKCGLDHTRALRRHGKLKMEMKLYDEAFDLFLKAARKNDWKSCSELY